ncbi:hypothetical protein M3090_09345 [Bacteroides sp. ET71]|uniref:hypothetical protein n=1 Tax=Bacteroides sp. ET71 TaxID=2939421 RepID=UPI00201284C1|nr:hypothetical protein [Bacteroides sp. ET71]MCL1616595.1 hypothetical protein [Bacteroides sp. ET71]
MELTCALLHPDARMVEKLQEWMKDMPFLRLCGCYTDTLEALRAYCVSRVDVYVVGIVPVSAGEVGGMDFCRMLSPHTRVIFIADREGYAAECFRLDALDYLVEKDLRFATFFQAVNKAMRWFACQKPGDAINGQLIGEWFKEQFGRLFSSIKRTVKPLRRDKGMRL